VVLITGYLTNDADEEVYAAFEAAVGRLRAPSFMLTGNHDDRDARGQVAKRRLTNAARRGPAFRGRSH
jgi:predicted MPP superfamily phosphohydrolase